MSQPFTAPPRLPMSRLQRLRLEKLIKVASDTLYFTSEERLNLDCDSRAYLDVARQAVSTFEFIVLCQPIKPQP